MQLERVPRRPFRFHLVGLLLAVGLAGPASAVSITIDYGLDTSGFFDTGTANGLAARARLGEAATFFSSLLTDTLDAITPGGINTWTNTFTNPSTGAAASMTDITLAQDELLVYAGARSIAGSTLGIGGFGGFSASGVSAFLNAVGSRGQTGVGTTDFAPWGGSLAFDTSATWYFGGGSAVPAGTNDFLSVALHELGHMLGIGGANSWLNTIVGDGSCSSGAAATGAAVSAANGGNACVESDAGHFLNGTSNGGQEVAMDPSLTTGTRKLFTALDIAALDDIGWETNSVPEPGFGLLLGMGFVALGLRRR